MRWERIVFSLRYNGENTMSKSSPRKRPCCICRKWFLPDVRQKNRQKTCDNPECRREHHRRQCAKWNKKNKEYFQSNYLNKKLEKVGKPPPDTGDFQPVTQKIFIPACRIRPILPRDITLSEAETRNLVIMDYFVEQLLARMRDNQIGFT
jgi:hypothetical protein